MKALIKMRYPTDMASSVLETPPVGISTVFYESTEIFIVKYYLPEFWTSQAQHAISRGRKDHDGTMAKTGHLLPSCVFFRFESH